MATALPTKRLVLRPLGRQGLDYLVTEMQTAPRVVESHRRLRPTDAVPG